MTHKERQPHTIYGLTRLLAVPNPANTDKARQDVYNQLDKCKRILFVYEDLEEENVEKHTVESRNWSELVVIDS